jgi:outer membrane protein assembly factor BamB
VSGGYGAWMTAGRYIPSGRILCFDDQKVYGFGRKPQYMVNASVLEYEFFAADKYTSVTGINMVIASNKVINAASSDKSANGSDWLLRSQFPREALTATRFAWTVEQPATICRAMAATSNTVFFAGTPGLINEQQAYFNPDDPDVLAKLEQQASALEGVLGGEIWAVAKTNGTVQTRYALDSPPVFDGMAAADGRLYIATVDGHIQCLSAEGTDLTDISHLPISTIWNP